MRIFCSRASRDPTSPVLILRTSWHPQHCWSSRTKIRLWIYPFLPGSILRPSLVLRCLRRAQSSPRLQGSPLRPYLRHWYLQVPYTQISLYLKPTSSPLLLNPSSSLMEDQSTRTHPMTGFNVQTAVNNLPQAPTYPDTNRPTKL